MKHRTNIFPRGFLVFALATTLLGVSVENAAQADSGEDPTTVRGRPALQEQITLGPDQAELWKQIQAVASEPTLIVDLAKLVPIFDLQMTDAVDFVSPSKPGPQGRNDLTSHHLQWMIQRIFYGIAKPGLHGDSPRDVGFGMQLDLRGICVSPTEVRKRYGAGVIGIPSHGPVPPISYVESAGLEFSEMYIYKNESTRQAVIFSYANSGCLESFEVRASLPN